MNDKLKRKKTRSESYARTHTQTINSLYRLSTIVNLYLSHIQRYKYDFELLVYKNQNNSLNTHKWNLTHFDGCRLSENIPQLCITLRFLYAIICATPFIQSQTENSEWEYFASMKFCCWNVWNGSASHLHDFSL